MKIDSVVWKMKKAAGRIESAKPAETLQFVSVPHKPATAKTLQFVSMPHKPAPVRTVQVIHRIEIVSDQAGEDGQ